MTLAMATTTISVRRVPDPSDTDPWERDAPATEPTIIATDIPADISVNVGRSSGPGDTETVEFMLICGPTDLTFRDTVVDDETGAEYEVQWVTLNAGLPGFEHIQAGLRQTTGFGNP